MKTNKNKILVNIEEVEEKILSDDKLTDKEKITLIKALIELTEEDKEEVLLG